MQSPRLTVSVTTQAFDGLHGAKARRAFYGSVPANASARGLVATPLSSQTV